MTGLGYIVWLFYAKNPHHPWMAGAAEAGALRARHLSASDVRRLISRPDRYYDLNWVWFGLAAADGYIDTRMPRIDRF